MAAIDTDTDSEDWRRTWDSLWEILGCKWTFHIVRLLSMDTFGFNEMQRELDGITSSMLSRRLTQLEDENLVNKTVEATSPPSISYQLTTTGHELATLLRQIENLKPANEIDEDEQAVTDSNDLT